MPTINEAAVLRFYVDSQGYSDRITAIEAQAASSLATHKTDVAAAIAQVNLTQSQTISALTLEVSDLKTNLTNSITATQTDLINRADQLAQNVTDITVQLTQDKATFTQEIQDALDYLKDDASVASALRTPRKIQTVPFDGTQNINLPVFTSEIDGLVPKRVGTTTSKYLREDGSWEVPTNSVVTLTKADVGLSNVDNTSDTEKPISVATQQALAQKVGKTDVIAVGKGGTGGTTPASARIGLGLGSASTMNFGVVPGTVMQVGSFGVGATTIYTLRVENLTHPNQVLGKGLRAGIIEGSKVGGTSPYCSAILLSAWHDTTATGAQPFILFSDDGHLKSMYSLSDVSGWGATVTYLSSRNTTVDANGFIKAASPIVQLFADKVELNDEAQQQEITFEKLGVGDYLIKGSSGFAQEGWYIEQPKDANGNIYHAVEYGTHDNGDIWVKMYEQMMDGTRTVADHTKPIDIIENRFISIRLNELPKDTAAPINLIIKDNEGNTAPSRLHELVEGVWVISDENAAILEQERLAAMQPLKRRQFRLTLAMNGYNLNEIEALINQIEDPMQRTIAQIEWQDATEFERTNPTLLMMAQMLGLSSEQVDSLWEYGLAL